MQILGNLIAQLDGTVNPIYRRPLNWWCWSKLSAANAFVLPNGMLVYLLNRLANVPAAQMYSFSSVTYQMLTLICWLPSRIGHNHLDQRPKSQSRVSQPQAVNPNNYGFINFIVCVSGFLIKLLSYSQSTCDHAPLKPPDASKLIATNWAAQMNRKKSKSFC